VAAYAKWLSRNSVPLPWVNPLTAATREQAARQTVRASQLHDSSSALVFATASSLTIEYGL